MQFLESETKYAMTTIQGDKQLRIWRFKDELLNIPKDQVKKMFERRMERLLKDAS